MNSIGDRLSIMLAQKHRRGENISQIIPNSDKKIKLYKTRDQTGQSQFEALELGSHRRQSLGNQKTSRVSAQPASVMLVDKPKIKNTDSNNSTTYGAEPPRFNENFVQSYLNAHNQEKAQPFSQSSSPKKTLIYQREQQMRSFIARQNGTQSLLTSDRQYDEGVTAERITDFKQRHLSPDMAASHIRNVLEIQEFVPLKINGPHNAILPKSFRSISNDSAQQEDFQQVSNNSHKQNFILPQIKSPVNKQHWTVMPSGNQSGHQPVIFQWPYQLDYEIQNKWQRKGMKQQYLDALYPVLEKTKELQLAFLAKNKLTPEATQPYSPIQQLNGDVQQNQMRGTMTDLQIYVSAPKVHINNIPQPPPSPDVSPAPQQQTSNQPVSVKQPCIVQGEKLLHFSNPLTQSALGTSKGFISAGGSSLSNKKKSGSPMKQQSPANKFKQKTIAEDLLAKISKIRKISKLQTASSNSILQMENQKPNTNTHETNPTENQIQGGSLYRELLNHLIVQKRQLVDKWSSINKSSQIYNRDESQEEKDDSQSFNYSPSLSRNSEYALEHQKGKVSLSPQPQVLNELAYVKKKSLKIGGNHNHHQHHIYIDENQRTGNSPKNNLDVKQPKESDASLPLLQNEGIKRRLMAAGQYKTADMVETQPILSPKDHLQSEPPLGDAHLLKDLHLKVRKIHSTNIEDIISGKDSYPLKINLPVITTHHREDRNSLSLGLTSEVKRNLQKIQESYRASDDESDDELGLDQSAYLCSITNTENQGK